ncbi:unnamed protein product [Colias eurytheme]|nr:unnamed protein product [Colias eurytheme]
MSDRDRSSPSLTDTPLKTYIGRHDDDYPLINGNAQGRWCCQVLRGAAPSCVVAEWCSAGWSRRRGTGAQLSPIDTP